MKTVSCGFNYDELDAKTCMSLRSTPFEKISFIKLA
jgi:hypothetical protein